MSSTPPEAPRRRPWIRALIGAGLAATAAAALLAVAGLAVVRPDLWVVEHVVFEGHERAGQAGLRHLADLRNGTTVWEVDARAVARGVQRHPWVHRARARFEWPDTVVVDIQEHVPVALLASGSVHYVNAQGTPFAPASTDDLDYPVLTGIDPALAELQPEVPRKAIRSALDLVQALEGAGVLDRDRIAEVHFDASRGFTVHVPGGARILFDLEGFSTQSERLARLVDAGVDLQEPLHIDLVPETVAIVRPLDAPAPALDVDARPILEPEEEVDHGEG